MHRRGIELTTLFSKIDFLELEQIHIQGNSTEMCRIRVGLRRSLEIEIAEFGGCRIYCSCRDGDQSMLICGEPAQFVKKDGVFTFDLYQFLKKRGFPTDAGAYGNFAPNGGLFRLDGYYEAAPNGFFRYLEEEMLAYACVPHKYLMFESQGEHLRTVICMDRGCLKLCEQEVYSIEHWSYLKWAFSGLLYAGDPMEFDEKEFFEFMRVEARDSGMLVLKFETDKASYTVGWNGKETTAQVLWNGDEYFLSGKTRPSEEYMLMLLLRLMERVSKNGLAGYVAKCNMLRTPESNLPSLRLPE